MSTDAVIVDRDSDVLTIRLNRPAKLNAMNAEMLDGITAGLRTAAADPAVKVVVVTGEGRAFCSGGDITTALSERRERLENTVAMSMRSVEVFSLMEWLPKPIISMVGGLAYGGGGMGLVLYSDLAVASDTAVFCCSMAARSLFEPYVATRLTARVGMERAKYMLLTTVEVDAARALEWGMVSEVHPVACLPDATRALAERLCACDPSSLRDYKHAVRRTLPGIDLGVFLNEVTDPETGAVMERFAKEFPP